MDVNENKGPIGVFDSGYGGLTILKEIRKALPQYNYLYLGDNARAPYGTRSFDTVYRFTLQAVNHLFKKGCPLVILACNTASAKALRSIQQNDLPLIDPTRRVLGVIRPTVEEIGNITRTGYVGVLGTPGTIRSKSYDMEIAKLHPDFKTFSTPCPMWVPLIENDEIDSPATDYFIEKYTSQLLNQSSEIDTVLLACTHYPLLADKIKKHIPEQVNIVCQGKIVAESLADYLHRHPEIENRCFKRHHVEFLTTENPSNFANLARTFLGHQINAQHIDL